MRCCRVVIQGLFYSTNVFILGDFALITICIEAFVRCCFLW
ncbi:putative membrane protein [Candidatus Ichthyocystis hellenicum]|uniref:Putative membrane protein n=1 Tax=Candidatus Ichthyocystis hellenicum TaxID=1561003 RepID=A0A0S4M2E1_9BURK|nr:putative membrane protein [Candidatus Ichthyocystis hellenicum]